MRFSGRKLLAPRDGCKTLEIIGFCRGGTDQVKKYPLKYPQASVGLERHQRRKRRDNSRARNTLGDGALNIRRRPRPGSRCLTSRHGVCPQCRPRRGRHGHVHARRLCLPRGTQINPVSICRQLFVGRRRSRLRWAVSAANASFADSRYPRPRYPTARLAAIRASMGSWPST